MKRVNETKIIYFSAVIVAANIISLFVLTQVNYVLGLFFVLASIILDLGVGAFFAALYEEIERANAERIEANEVYRV